VALEIITKMRARYALSYGDVLSEDGVFNGRGRFGACDPRRTVPAFVFGLNRSFLEHRYA
jgi:hypothetical protein